LSTPAAASRLPFRRPARFPSRSLVLVLRIVYTGWSEGHLTQGSSDSVAVGAMLLVIDIRLLTQAATVP
jgi:hypothetical protein